MRLKTFIASDFHLDFWDSDLTNKEDVFYRIDLDPNDNYDLIILAGDIGQCNNSFNKGRYIQFIKHICSLGVPVILIKGNHENYQNTLVDSKYFCKNLSTLFDNLYFLEGNYIDLVINNQKVRIFGATLWTNFDNHNPLAMLEANAKMNDFGKMILKPGFGKFLATDAYAEFITTWNKLVTASQSINDDTKFIIVTHHAPLQKFSDNFRKQRGWEEKVELLDFSYFSDCSKMFNELKRKPDYWICGHIHAPIEFTNFDIKFISNPYGYEPKYEKRLYQDPFRILEFKD